MRPIIVGNKYLMTTPQGSKVVVIVKEVDGASAASMGFVRVEIESNGIQTHVKRTSLREIKAISKNKRKPEGKKIGLITYLIGGVILAMFVLAIWK